MSRSLNIELLKLYEERVEKIAPLIFDYNETLISNKGSLQDLASNPFLLKSPSDWSDSQMKVMIFGQETNFWGGEVSPNGIFCNLTNDLINIYEEFYLRDNMYPSPFWNTFREIKTSIKYKYPSASFIWNNVVKIGRLGKGYVPKVRDISVSSFNVIPDELQILKPDLIIFLSGPNYDLNIELELGKFSKKPLLNTINERQLSEIFLEKHPRIKCFRTYHPGFLNRDFSRKKTFLNAIEEMV